MRRILLLLTMTLIGRTTYSQEKTITGVVLDRSTNFPVPGVSILAPGSHSTAITNEHGRFQVRWLHDSTRLLLSALGYVPQTLTAGALKQQGTIWLEKKNIQLSEVSISSEPALQYQSISRLDVKMRGINNSQEVLRLVPGLFIGQHAGGGKAEQLFLRGFDLDHGTDINITVDGMAVNMVSHAHGQGYADLHFVIPELIDNVNFRKGPYYADKGNFTTSGAVDFQTFNTLPNNMVKAEAGAFNTFRAVAMTNLLGARARAQQQSAYLAAEYMYSDGYFDHPQDFNRFNLFGKYFGKLGDHSLFNFSASTFYSKWMASGQIPDRAVKDGEIGFFGAIDPNEGGSTSRTNANAQLTTTLGNGATLKNQLYFTQYNFELFSNFTFFKEDPVNGDQIKQKEHRNLLGYNSSYQASYYLGNTKLASEAGINVRADRTQGSELSRTKDRVTVTNAIRLGNIAETNLAAYLNETFAFTNRLSLNAGLRYDHFFNRYTDRLNNNSKGHTQAGILSPKLNLTYQYNPATQFYINTGKGFHSNDTRVVVPQNGLEILPAAYGTDIGAILKPTNNLLLNAAVWYLWLNQEFVYVGDEGVVEPSGKSRRLGFDLSARYQPVSWLYLDVDMNYSNGRAADAPRYANYLPLAPVFTSTGGLTVKTKQKVNGSIRYRYMGNRPANEDNSVIAKGYFITDAFINYSLRRYEFGVAVQNLFDARWKETQFETESRLYNEAAPVSEIHFTPGTPISWKLSAAYLF